MKWGEEEAVEPVTVASSSSAENPVQPPMDTEVEVAECIKVDLEPDDINIEEEAKAPTSPSRREDEDDDSDEEYPEEEMPDAEYPEDPADAEEETEATDD